MGRVPKLMIFNPRIRANYCHDEHEIRRISIGILLGCRANRRRVILERGYLGYKLVCNRGLKKFSRMITDVMHSKPARCMQHLKI